MYALPIFRRPTLNKSGRPKPKKDGDGIDTFYSDNLESALKLVSSAWNHYTCIIRSDYYGMAAWGNCYDMGVYGRMYTGVASNSLSPSPIDFSGVNGGKIGRIIRAITIGGPQGYTLVHTESGQLAGTGYDLRGIMNNGGVARDTFGLIASNVKEFSTGQYNYILYIKGDQNKLYGLGDANAAFGPKSGSNLHLDDGSDVNYLGISDVKHVITIMPHNGSDFPGGYQDYAGRTFCIMSDGTVKAVGNNTSGCLGVNSSNATITDWTTVVDSSNNPIQNVTNIYGSFDPNSLSTYFSTSDGFVYVCGANNYGQLGLGLAASDTKKAATSISDITNAINVVGANYGRSVLVYTTDNKVWTWGLNQYGECGQNSTNAIFTATKATFPDKKIKMAHGGGLHCPVVGVFGIITDDGSVYGAGYNGTYALGLNNGGVDVHVFTENKFFGPNPQSNQNPQKYPLTITGSVQSGSIFLTTNGLFQNKTFSYGTRESYNKDVYLEVGMGVSGDGLQENTKIIQIDTATNRLMLDRPAISTQTNKTYSYSKTIRAYQIDMCGYLTELCQKVVTEDSTLYISGWNQHYGNYWNWNPYINTDSVDTPTEFDSHFKNL
jgi:hypothetical protein